MPFKITKNMIFVFAKRCKQNDLTPCWYARVIKRTAKMVYLMLFKEQDHTIPHFRKYYVRTDLQGNERVPRHNIFKYKDDNYTSHDICEETLMYIDSADIHADEWWEYKNDFLMEERTDIKKEIANTI